jgi:hypothetical protein
LGEVKAAHTRRSASGGGGDAQKASRWGEGRLRRVSSRPACKRGGGERRRIKTEKSIFEVEQRGRKAYAWGWAAQKDSRWGEGRLRGVSSRPACGGRGRGIRREGV